MFTSTFQYKTKDMDCKLCTQYVVGKGCTAVRCPWMAERVASGAVSCRETNGKEILRDHRLKSRLSRAVQRIYGSLYLTAGHRQRIKDLEARQGRRRGRDTSAYFAAVYLLTANEDLFHRTADCFCEHGLEFSYAALRDISPHNYTLFNAARDIYEDRSSVVLADLASMEMIDDLAFILIVNALLIARRGRVMLKIKKKEAQT